MSQLDAAALLEKLIEQNAELLRAHQEGMRLQRLLVEHLVGVRAAADPAPAPAADPPPVEAPAAAHAATRPAVPPSPPTDADAPPAALSSDEPLPEPPPEEPPPEERPRPRPLLRVVPPPRRAPPQARPTLAALHRLAHIGEEGQIVVNFGPHKGRTLAAIAAADPEHLMTLAARAGRPEVRVAARRVASVLNNRGHYER